MTVVFFRADTLPLTQGEAESMVRPLDAVGTTSRRPVADIIRAWIERPLGRPPLTHWEQAMTAGPDPVDLSAERVGLVPRQMRRLFAEPGARGEVWRCDAAGPFELGAAESLSRWAARFHKGYDLMGAIRSSDAADAILGPGKKPNPFQIWCSQSLFRYCRSKGPAFELDATRDPDKDGVDTGELHTMLANSIRWRRVFWWETREI